MNMLGWGDKQTELETALTATAGKIRYSQASWPKLREKFVAEITQAATLHIAETIEKWFEDNDPSEPCIWQWKDFFRARRDFFQDDAGNDYLIPHKWSEPIGDEFGGIMREVLDNLVPHFTWTIREDSSSECRTDIYYFTLKESATPPPESA